MPIDVALLSLCIRPPNALRPVRGVCDARSIATPLLAPRSATEELCYVIAACITLLREPGTEPGTFGDGIYKGALIPVDTLGECIT